MLDEAASDEEDMNLLVCVQVNLMEAEMYFRSKGRHAEAVIVLKEPLQRY